MNVAYNRDMNSYNQKGKLWQVQLFVPLSLLPYSNVTIA